VVGGTPLLTAGLWVGIAGNQTARAGGLLRDLGLPADMIATSDDWGVAKPAPGFFRKMIEASPCEPEQTLYVGDRLDNDIVPAARLGLRTALINRGPWALGHADPSVTLRVYAHVIRDLVGDAADIFARSISGGEVAGVSKSVSTKAVDKRSKGR
jgi:FMN phosphatase YigB (HAD superfamily)